MNKRTKHKHVKRHAEKPVSEIEGVIRISSRGYGYVEAPGLEQDLEIPPELLNTALNRDRVRAIPHPKKHGKRMRGEVLEVLERAKTRFVGTIQEVDGYRFVRPDDRKVYTDFIVERGQADDAPLGQKVLVELVRWSSPTKNPLVHVLDVLGPGGEHETEMRSVVAAQGFDWNYPPEVLHEAEELERVKTERFAHEIPRRRDFRSIPTFTIDPADAKDFDDAISIRKLDNGNIELGVHIADVSAYVTRDGAIDKEAQKRGTSIYLVDRTIPMLPEALSTDLCSLVPHEDRLTMSAVFEMTMEGEVLSRWFGETVIRSAHRFSYQEAQETLNRASGELYDELLIADTISRALRKERFAHGSIGFETDEVKFELDEFGRPIRAFRKERLETMMMIEDLMLLANREVATWVAKTCESKKIPCVFVWRIHDSPKPDRIQELSLFLKVLGYDLPHKNGIVTAQAINALFDEIGDSPESDMIETATIRSMAKAIYSTKNIGHFGLAFSYYTHFTSPIRRYPDLMVHRIVKAHNEGHPPGGKDMAWHERMCAQSSEREIAAAEAERDSIKLKQVEYMASHVGEKFEGVITGISDYGIFVEETSTKAEGLVRLSTLRDDFYTMASHGYRLTGTRTGKNLSLGDRVRVRLTSVDIEQKQINWELV